MARRRLTVRRIDPWSVLKFGAVANVVLLVIWLLIVGVVFYIIDRIGLVDQVCDIVLEVGFQECSINAGNLFRAIALLGLLGVVILTAVLVFLSFLHNLIADLTGGLTFTVLDDTPVTQRPGAGGGAAGTTGPGAITSARTPPSSPTGAGRSAPRDGTGSPPVAPIGRDRDTVRHDPVAGGDDTRRSGGDTAGRPRRGGSGGSGGDSGHRDDEDDLFRR